MTVRKPQNSRRVAAEARRLLDEKPLTVTEAARRLGLSRQSVYNLIHERRIGHIASPGITGDRRTYKIPAAEVDRYLSEHYKAATA